ncbi:SDR family oxidoreductase [Amycolatopsis jejuensis]|uniref:SDR family oxidoreductase n=1 Tax=Amycolatopsis jejuensis TaxID=330084 RepID=UPI00052763B3|nr:SDR family oxidoreductase [Amycolatopsis jejuensis]
MTTSAETQSCVVVTGASTGLGAASARELARRGFHVLAGVRRDQDADAIRAPGVEPVILDVTKPEHIADLAARIAEWPGALRALVNNAAISVTAPFETLPLDEWRRTFEVNLFGQIAVTQALLPALLRHSGRVVNISSIGGKVALATCGPYSGTKFALEAVSDALRREVAPLGMHVVVVEPGAVRTAIGGRAIAETDRLAAAMSPEQQERYGPLLQATNANTAANMANGRSADQAAQVIAKAVTAGKPRTRYTIGWDAALFTRLARLLPDRLLDRITAARISGS